MSKIGSFLLNILAQTETHRFLETVHFQAGTQITREGDPPDGLLIVLAGRARVFRGELALSVLGPGDAFGELGLLTGQPRNASVRALTPLDAYKLSDESLQELTESQPNVAFRLIKALVAHLGVLLTDMTDAVGWLLREQLVPQRSQVDVVVGGKTTTVRSGMPIDELFPEEIDGERVIAAVLDRKAVSLSTPLFSDAVLEPLTRSSPQGREIYRRSVGVLVLEAAFRLNPKTRISMGPSLGFAHLLQVDEKDADLNHLADALNKEMGRLVSEDVPFRRERWSVGEAEERFREQGWENAVRALRTWRERSVPLVSCGSLYAIQPGPVVPSASHLDAFNVVVDDGRLLLYFHSDEANRKTLVQAANPDRLAHAHEHWLKSLGITCVGALNDVCVSGKVSQIIRVSEGFHEKRIGDIAENIASRPEPVRVICIAGPSSAGKTTFIRRLGVQLRVNGLTPKSLSLDDYYVDRVLTVRDENGDYDFEAFENLRLDLMGQQLESLFAGNSTKTARFDFKIGKSHPTGRRELQLGPSDILLLEGIHALNEKLPLSDESGVFRIFVNPMTSLPLDNLTRISVTDIRLLRRIVRDRNRRSISAAENITRWPSVRRGELRHIFPNQGRADVVFNSSLIYEASVLKVFAEPYLLEVPRDHPSYTTAHRLRQLIDAFVTILPDEVPNTSLLREFIGGSGFERSWG